MIELRNLCKSYERRVVVEDVSMTIEDASFTVLIGPSGCGKSTTMRMINRLIVPDSGQVLLDGRDVATADLETLRRGIGYAIQAVGLFPHWTVSQNIATVPRLLGWPEAKIAARVDELLNLLNLPPERFANQRPGRLSGGQQQRVGVARALAADPPVLLMDEPFGALDPLTRRDLQIELRRIQKDTSKTIVFVTHDIDEAVLLADRIAIMERGKLVQYGPASEILLHPASDFVREFTSGDSAGLRLLSVRHVRDYIGTEAAGDVPAIGEDATLREALSCMLDARTDHLAVRDADGQVAGRIDLASLIG